MDIYFSTVVRGGNPEQGGEIVWLDWRSKRLRARVPIVPTNPRLHDPNPRGNTRGGRGIELVGPEVLVCSYHTLKIFDRELNHRRDVSHGLMVGLHETFLCGGARVWVASTAIDAAIQFDLSSGEMTDAIWPREMVQFQEQFDLEPLPIDKGSDNRAMFLQGHHVAHSSHLHLNAITCWNENVYCLFNRFGAVVNLTQGKTVIEDPALRGGHNLLVLEDGTAIVNGTKRQAVHCYDIQSGAHKLTLDLLDFSWIHKLLARHLRRSFAKRVLRKLGIVRTSISKPLFVRGLQESNGLLFVGLSPASIVCIDLARRELVDAYCYSTNVNACIHGLQLVPSAGQ